MRVKLFRTLIAALLLSVSISGCGSMQPAAAYQPTEHVLPVQEPIVKTQIKAFTLIKWIKDTSLKFSTAVCRFHNSDAGDNSMPDALIINGDDFSEMLNRSLANARTIKAENARRRVLNADVNTTQE
jgi:hypothetical protein